MFWTSVAFLTAALAALLGMLHLTAMAAGGSFAGPKSDWRALAAAVQRAERAGRGLSGDIVVTPAFLGMPFGYCSRGRLPRNGYPRRTRPLGAVERDTSQADLERAARRLARARMAVVVCGTRTEGHPGRRLVHRVLELRGPARFRPFQSADVFAFGRAAYASGGIRVDAASLDQAVGRQR